VPVPFDRPLDRRHLLAVLGGVGTVALIGCADDSDEAALPANRGTTVPGTNGVASTPSSTAAVITPSTAPTIGAASSTEPAAVSCTLVAEETEGPFGLDLSDSEQYVRRHITEGKDGLPLTLTMTVLDVDNGCTPLEGARVDVWHCDADGVYSGFSQPDADTAGETFCRGIQLTDDAGQVLFTTVYPGWYTGRITHIHFQVFLDNGRVATSQLAFPEDVTEAVYNSDRYAVRGQNSSVASFDDDGVFSDGVETQVLMMSGDATSGYTGAITVGIAT
jgi:protocatechuate 3,4-dioxygenase beta subunit